MKSQRLRNSVEEQVQAGLSPQQIAGVLKRSKAPQYCSHKAIYHYIYKEGPDLIPYLRKKHKKRRKRDIKTSRKFAILGKTPLSERGAISDEYGHYEVDLVGSSSKATILVVLEKRTRHLWLHKIQNKTAHTMKYALLLLFRAMPAHMRKSLIYDNGSENAYHCEVNERRGTQSFFCNPYCSWEKGAVENALELIREYFRSNMLGGTFFHTVKHSEIAHVQYLLNNRPRKCLDFQPPAECFSVALTG